jgi:hypothetical protein
MLLMYINTVKIGTNYGVLSGFLLHSAGPML